MPPNLLERARSAVTVEEECDAVRDFVCQRVDDAARAMPLIDIIVAVRAGRLPRAVLLGVVAALVPRRDDIATVNLQIWPDFNGSGLDQTDAELCDWIDTGPSVDEPIRGHGSAASPAIALLIAIREASNAD